MRPPGGAPQSPADQMRGQRSVLNGTDMAARIQESPIDPERTTLREFLETHMGLDVDGPVSQLMQWQQRQVQTKDPINKATPPPAGGNPPGRPPSATTGPSGGNLETLRREVMQPR